MDRMVVVRSVSLNMIHHSGVNVIEIGSDPFCIQPGIETMIPIR